MTTWKDGGAYGQIRREIVNEDGDHPIATVRTRQYLAGSGTEPWPEGEANFRLILAAPETAKALETIAEGAIVSPEQPPEKIAEQTLRVLRLAREENLKYLSIIYTQQKQAEQMLEALKAIYGMAERLASAYMSPMP